MKLEKKNREEEEAELDGDDVLSVGVYEIFNCMKINEGDAKDKP